MEASVGNNIHSSTSTQESSSEQQLDWEPLVLTDEKIIELWKKLQEFDVVWDDFNRGNFEAFVDKLTSRDSIFIDIGHGTGIAAGLAVRPRLDMILHLVMFDRRLRGREPLLKEIMRFFFEKLQLRRMTCVIAEDAKTALKLASRLGFAHEGTMRQAILRKGNYLDAEIFGILKEECEDEPAIADREPAEEAGD